MPKLTEVVRLKRTLLVHGFFAAAQADVNSILVSSFRFLLEHSLVTLLNYKQRNKKLFVEVDILLLPDPPFGTMLIFPQVPLVECSVKFSVQSSPAWIEKNRTNSYERSSSFFKIF